MKTGKRSGKIQQQRGDVVAQEGRDRGPQQDWAQFWPGAEVITEGGSEVVVQEVVADLEQRSVQDYLDGHRSESQGE